MIFIYMLFIYLYFVYLFFPRAIVCASSLLRDGKNTIRERSFSMSSKFFTANNTKDENDEAGRRKKPTILFIILIVIIVLICLFLRSCRARDEPLPKPHQDTERVYEDDVEKETVIKPTKENKRLNLAISEHYRISDEKPVFYIGFPEENIFDVVLTLKDGDGKELYKTNYIAPGTNVAIDGTAFLSKGEQKVDCLVSIYDHENGYLISECTTVVLNMIYE